MAVVRSSRKKMSVRRGRSLHSPDTVRVLSISDSDAVRSSRERLLRNVGYKVVSVESETVIKRQATAEADIAVIGHTIDDGLASHLAALLRRTHPAARILRLSKHPAPPDPVFDGFCLLDDGPAVFLRCLEQLIEKGHTRNCRG